MSKPTITLADRDWTDDTILIPNEDFYAGDDEDQTVWPTKDLNKLLGFSEKTSRRVLGSSIYLILKRDDKTWCPEFTVCSRETHNELTTMYFSVEHLMPMADHIMEQINNLKAIEVKHGLSR